METATAGKDKIDAPHKMSLRWLAPGDRAAGAVYAQCVQPSLLQYPLYGETMAARSFHHARRAVIESDGEAVGMAQILDGTLAGGFFHSITLDAGPVWLPGRGDDADCAAFFKILGAQYPARATRHRRVIPAGGDHVALSAAGFRHSAGSVNQSIWMDLSRNEDELRTALRKTWRHDLQNANKTLRVEWDDTGRTLPWILRNESIARQDRRYRGPSSALVMALARRLLPERGILAGRALLAGRPVAGIIIAIHPPAATWLVGWAGADGRAHHAHNLLLWEGLCVLKQRGIGYFDLGGVNDETARNVKRFKEGLGGQLVSQPGLYR